MAQMQPEQAVFTRDVIFLPTIKNEFGLTKRVIAAIPDNGDYRPDPAAKSAMELAYHLAVTEMRFLDAVASGEFDFTPRPKPETITTSADLAAWYESNFNAAIARVEAASPETLAKIVDFRGMFQLPGVMFLGFVNNHTVHHRGQLSVYLRPMGGKVPAIYGESYDSAKAKASA